uniref:Growth-regulating factor n=1 Tax=Opuntia streptacantha TaxID=393608 RepID=A0A7C9D0J2_OPUST
MLSFSSLATPEFSFLTGKEMGLIEGKSAQSISLSYYQQSAYPKCSAGFESGNLNGGIHGSLTGIKGTFTPAQWIELENQAMVYRYISANVPVPAHLLIPIRKSLSSAGFPGFSVGSYPTHSCMYTCLLVFLCVLIYL